MPARKPATLQYVCLAVLFLMTCAFQLRAIEFAFPGLFGQHPAAWPVVPDYRGGIAVMRFVTEPAAAAGIKDGDQMISVNGRQLTGLGVWGEEISKTKPGSQMSIGYRSHGDATDRLATFTLQPARFGGGSGATLGNILVIGTIKLVLPVFCLLLGFWVAFVRPRDVSAWLLIAVLYGICTVYGVGIESWGRGVRDVAQVFRILRELFRPLSMLLFGLYFPESFDYKPPSWMRLPIWFVSAGLFFCFVVVSIHDVGILENFQAVAGLDAFLNRFSWVPFALSVTAASGFFMFMRIKYHAATSPDVKRRFNLVYFGATIGLSPLLVLVIVQLFNGRNLEEIFPEWVVLAAFGMLADFPGHTGLRHRRSTRHGRPHGGAPGPAVRPRPPRHLPAADPSECDRHHRRREAAPEAARLPEVMLIVALGFIAILWLRRLAERSRAWIDKRFFRDAYNADQILSGLSDEVRSIVETRPLLERVTQRIAESLHVARITVLTEDEGWFKPAYALGHASLPDAYLASSGATIQKLSQDPEPARVYLDDGKILGGTPECFRRRTTQYLVARPATASCLSP